MKKRKKSAEKKHPAPAKGHPAPERGGESEHKKRAGVVQDGEFKRTKTSRGYIVVQRTAEEIKSRLRALADDG